ncbi:MAG: PadR family transcriptional regulator [Gemmatimonadetes bacterium]|nr:PadR family transcriptional regulator [Gemmatimonadota bacterium]
MARKNTTEVAVMGLLALGARTGYDVRKDCEEKLSHFWSESYGQIYPVLKALHERGWVVREPVAGSGPTRYEHQLTDEGLSALRDWIVSPPQPLRVRDELLLKMFLGRLVDRKDLGVLLRAHAKRASARRDGLLAIRKLMNEGRSDFPDAPFWLVTVDFGIRSLEAQAEWADASLKALCLEETGEEDG